MLEICSQHTGGMRTICARIPASPFRGFVLASCLLLSLCAVVAGEPGEEDQAMTVFFEDFSSHGASSAKRPKEWLNPTWHMPKSSDGKWWIININYYATNRSRHIARQGLVGDMQIGRRVWATTTDFRIAPDPVEDAFILSLKVLGMNYCKGVLNLRLIDKDGNGYGCILAMQSEEAKKNAITRWQKGKDTIIKAGKGAAARLPLSKEGIVSLVTLRLSKGGIVTLSADDKLIAETVDKSFTRFTALGLSVEYETRFVIDDIKLKAFIDLDFEE